MCSIACRTSIPAARWKCVTTLGEQVGCVLVLARMAPTAMQSANHVELVMSSGPDPAKMMETEVRRQKSESTFGCYEELLLGYILEDPGNRPLVLASVFCLLTAPLCAGKWRIAYFYDKENSSLVINDVQFPSAGRGVAAGYLEDKGDFETGQRDHRRWRRALDGLQAEGSPGFAVFPERQAGLDGHARRDLADRRCGARVARDTQIAEAADEGLFPGRIARLRYGCA
jgi:hypothetical protein